MRGIRWRRCTRCWPGRGPGGWWCSTTRRTGRRSQPFVPPAGPGRVLITTQNQHWPPGQALEVPVLDPEVAADFLVTRTGDADRAAARELAGQLGGLPLALEQAAAYMQATGTTLARYLPLFRDRQADLLARGEVAGHRGRGGDAGAGPVPAGRRSPGGGGAGAAAGVPGARAGAAGACCWPVSGADRLSPEVAAAVGAACWVIRWRPGMRSPRCAGTRWSPRPGTGWCWCTGWCRPSPAPSSRRRRPTSGSRPPPPWSRRRSPPTRSCRRRGRCARCCCRTPGPSWT